jgi:hypothetical protein
MILFRKLWPLCCASFISKVGEFAYEVVFALLAIQLLEGDLFFLGVVYFLRFIPYVLFGVLGGWIADNFSQKYNMLLSDSYRCFIAGVLCYFYFIGSLNIYVLLISSMLMTIGRSLYQPSFRAYLPSVLNQKDLPVGNSLFQVVEDVASILGPLVCAMIIHFADKGYVIYMYAGGYFFSMCSLIYLKSNPERNNAKFSLLSVFSEAKNTAKNMRLRNRNLFFVITGTSICVLFTASLLRFVLPASIVNSYGNEALVGYVFSVMSLGTVLGGFCYVRLVKSSNPKQLMSSWMVYGLLFLATSVAINFHVSGVFIIVLFLGFCGAIVDISIITNIQMLSAKSDIGKNYSIFSIFANTCEAVSGLVSALLFILVGSASFSIISLLIAVSAKSIIFRMKRVDYEK